MSFAAVTALIAFYEARRRADKTRARPASASASASASVSASLWAARRTGFYVAALIATTLVASAATAPFILYHFQRLAPFGLAGNLFALPVVGFLVMPAGLISVIAMPFGLEPLSLPVMAAGIEWVLRVAETIAALPGAERPVAAPPAAALALAVLGGLWLTLWRRRWRGFGLLGFAAAGLVMLLARPPDVVIAPQGRVLAVRGADGALDLKRFGRSTFAAEILLARYGDGRPVEQVAEDAFSCDKLACVAPLPDGGYMAFVSHRAALAEECARARVLVAAFELKRPCEGPQLVVDRVEEPEFRASALWLGRNGVEVHRAGTAPGARPWSRPAPKGRRASTDE
jgi:competence protein ComEC